MANHIYINTDLKDLTANAVANINRPTQVVRLPQIIEGEVVDVVLHLVKSDGQYDARSGTAVDVEVAVSAKGKAATSGTFRLNAGIEITGALTWNASAEAVAGALNALNGGTGAYGSQVSVSKLANGVYRVIFNDAGVRVDMAGQSLDLAPESTIGISTSVVGSGSIRAQQVIEISQQPAIYSETWASVGSTWTGQLDANTSRVQEMIAGAAEAFFEIKVGSDVVCQIPISILPSVAAPNSFPAHTLPDNLDAFAANPTTNGFFSPANWRDDLSLVVGEDVQAWSTNLDELAARMSWNNQEKTFDIVTGSSNVTIQVGQEVLMYARNASGLQMTDGQVVKVVGSQGNNPTIALAQADTVENASGVIGVVTQVIDNNSNGFVSLIGKVRDLNLDSGTFTEGDLLYLSSTVAGGFTLVRPDIGVEIGRVIATSSGGNNAGIIEVNIDNDSSVHELEQQLLILINDNTAAIAAKIPNDSTTGTPSATTFLRGDNAWATPAGGGGGGNVATDTIWDAKGDLAGGTGADTAARLAVGSDGQVLAADSAEATGLKWSTPATGDMLKSVYDPSNKNVTAFSMGNMDETATAKILTATERSEIAANVLKVTNATHTGDVTGDGALTITDNAVTLAKMADMATASLLGRNTAGAGDPEVLSATTARSLLNVEDGADVTDADNVLPAIENALLVDRNTPAANDQILLRNATGGDVEFADFSEFVARANHTGTQLASTISDFDTEVSNNASVVDNSAKVTNATHTGDVTGDTALTIAVDAVDIPMLSATGTADGTTFLRGDNVWATPAGGGDVATDAIWDAKGDLAGGTGADAAARLAVGANNQVLTADSAEATGMKWTTIAGGAPVDASETVSGVVQIPTDLEVVNATTTGSTGAELPILVTQAALLAGYTNQPSLFTVLRGKLKTAAFPDASLLTSYGFLRLVLPSGDLAATDYGFVFTGGSYNPNFGQSIYNFNWSAKYFQFSVMHTFNVFTGSEHSIYWDFGSHYSVADGSTQLTRKGIGFRLGVVGGVRTLYGTSYGTAYNEVDFGTISIGNILQLLARKVGNTIEWWVNGNLAGSINSTTNPTHVPSGTSSNYQHKYRCGIHMDAAVVGGTASLHYLSEPIITVLPV